jgi:hypothetical protein
MSTDTREDSRKARRARDMEAAFRKHPVLMPTVIGVGVFICVAGRLYGERTSHAWWAFPIAAGCALLVVGLALWFVRRARRNDNMRG